MVWNALDIIITSNYVTSGLYSSLWILQSGQFVQERPVPLLPSSLHENRHSIMGNQTSTLGRDCLLSATGNDASRVSYPGDISHAGRDLEALNLNIPVVPAAITYPNTADEISNIVRCAADYGFKVQPKSGGHSYGNYGMN